MAVNFYTNWDDTQLGFARMALATAQAGGHPDPYGFVGKIAIESSFRPGSYNAEAIDKGGAHGLGQILPGTADMLGLAREDMYDPQKNLSAAVRYDLQNYGKFKDDDNWRDLMYASYFTGPGNARKGLNNWKSVREYVGGHDRYRDYFKQKLNDGSGSVPQQAGANLSSPELSEVMGMAHGPMSAPSAAVGAGGTDGGAGMGDVFSGEGNRNMNGFDGLSNASLSAGGTPLGSSSMMELEPNAENLKASDGVIDTFFNDWLGYGKKQSDMTPKNWLARSAIMALSQFLGGDDKEKKKIAGSAKVTQAPAITTDHAKNMFAMGGGQRSIMPSQYRLM